ncbi:hypothetical protein NQ315_010332 [Exocentrus adspersus]|uniref:COG complex component COG2 C-terminal domain-containing protein n=1 Tax=Exocentrus adspersus TaxID=1586481 RepID=A0AAV8WBZ8_9CUCU|nr:hypothetical protein NQ315_010332 [Exocentrus adspersus]
MDELGVLSKDAEGIVKNIENKLLEMVNKRFLDAFKTGDQEILTRCLRMYDNLKKQDEAQKTFQVNVVRPALSQWFNERNLEKSHQDVNQIYEEVLIFMNTKMNVLFEILAENPELKCYNFTLNSFWKEFDKLSREGLPYITAPGNPELFQKRYKSTWTTLLKIARKCGSEDLLQEDDTFQDHLKRFNLPVYFEIRYQQIAGGFETDILNNTDVYASNNELSCKLKNTITLWKAVRRCYDEHVYLDQLADQFLKLSLMLLSRYLRWFQTTLQEKSLFSDDEQWEAFVMNSLIDLNIVTKLLAPTTDSTEDVDKTVFKTMHPCMRLVVIKIFKSNRTSIEEVQQSLKNYLINIKFQETSTHLQNVGAIPRLYRRTNRSAPKSASTYMIEAVKPITNFQNKFKAVIEGNLDEILDSVISKVTQQYLTLVQEVLMSVCKTEESLRRLKSRNINPNEEASPQADTMSDERKIREQIKYDLYALGSPLSKATMDKLKQETS